MKINEEVQRTHRVAMTCGHVGLLLAVVLVIAQWYWVAVCVALAATILIVCATRLWRRIVVIGADDEAATIPCPPPEEDAEEKAEQAAKKAAAQAAMVRVGEHVAVFDSPLVRIAELHEWAPVVAVYYALSQDIMVSVRDADTATRLFGPGGLQGVLPLLGEGWEAGEVIARSPWRQELTFEDTAGAARRLAAAIRV